MHRLYALVLLLALLAAGAGEARTAARADAEALDPRLAGFPELEIRLTEERIEAPARVAAGRTLVIEENLGAEPGHAFILRVPDDVPEAELAAALAARTSAAEATPEWFWRSTLVGNPDCAAPDGGRAVALVDLVPGRYLVGDPYRPGSEYARLEVGEGGDAADRPEPAADVVAGMHEMAFDMPAELVAGRQVWQVQNTGAALHEIAVMPVPAGATTEQVVAALGAALAAEAAGESFEDQGAPADLGPAWMGWEVELVAGVGATSPTRSVWAQIDLAPGTYAAVCFVPDPATFTPHAMMGMIEVFTVAAPAA